MIGDCASCRREAELHWARDAHGTIWALCDRCLPPLPTNGLDGCRGLAAVVLFAAALALGVLVGYLVRGV